MATEVGPEPGYADEIAAIVKSYVEGPPLRSPGSLAAGSATEDRAVDRWRDELLRRARLSTRRDDANAEGLSFATSIVASLRSDLLLDSHSSILQRTIGSDL